MTASKVSAAALSMASALSADQAVTIQSAAGWYKTLCPMNRIDQQSEGCWSFLYTENWPEQRLIDGSTFFCWPATLMEEKDHLGTPSMSDWTTRPVQGTSEVFYTTVAADNFDPDIGYNLYSNAFLTTLPNETIPYLSMQRACMPKGLNILDPEHSFLPVGGSCVTYSPVTAADCPAKCMVPNADDDTAYFCQLNFADPDCTGDTRCVPKASRFKPNKLGKGSLQLQDKCLVGRKSDVFFEDCDATKPSQLWTFATAETALAV